MMWETCLVGSLVVISLFYWKTPILKRCNRLRSSIVEYLVDLYLERSMVQMEKKMGKVPDIDAAPFTIYTTQKAASITYWRNGKQYMISVPYHRENLGKDTQRKVILHAKGYNLDITQQPGIPYLVTPGMIGGEYAIIHYRGSVERIETDQYII